MAPICGKDRVFGVITADNLPTGRPLDESDRDGLMLFAAAAGLALENTGLFDRLSVSEARHRLVLDNSPVAILGLAENFTITTWNRGAEAMFGHAAAEVIGRPIESLFPNNPDDYARLVGDVGARGGVREYAIAGVNKKKQPLDLMLSWDGSRPDGAANKEWAVVIRDVTEANKMQRQLIFSEKLSAVGQLISGIAHELNNPLQAVVGYAEILNAPRAPGSEMPTREIKHIADNAARCRKIIDNLLLFVRQGEVKKTTIKVQDVVRASLELLQHKIKKTAGVQVTADLPEEILYAKANFQQIEQVIVNITNNACDAMEGWEGPRKLVISARATDSIIRVSLADTGPGIPEEVCARIFEPFFTTKPEGRGTGLGLPVCRQIVNEHGGELHVETTIGTGTTFWFELALAQPEAAARGATARPAPPRRPRPGVGRCFAPIGRGRAGHPRAARRGAGHGGGHTGSRSAARPVDGRPLRQSRVRAHSTWSSPTCSSMTAPAWTCLPRMGVRHHWVGTRAPAVPVPQRRHPRRGDRRCGQRGGCVHAPEARGPQGALRALINTIPGQTPCAGCLACGDERRTPWPV